ncbi:MAG TPA: hypothetical protein VFI13_07165, partial [Gemmatimonadales bacterium]|nr:hypothetical protein [Gemmatimonadales bacterium]
MSDLSAALDRLQQGHHLTAADTAAAFGAVMRGEATHGQIRALLLALKSKGETADEVAGAAAAMRATMVRLPRTPDFGPRTSDLVDTC